MPTGFLYGDNLTVLRELNDNSVALIYLDPPFNSRREYNVTIEESMAHEWAYADTWTWDDKARETWAAFQKKASHGSAKTVVGILNGLSPMLLPKGGSTFSYLVMMAPRLLEMHRILKTTGTLYLHCDPNASHYLKILLDAVFGGDNFRAEIVWKRTASHNKVNRPGSVHDVILMYSKSSSYTWNPQYDPYTEEHLRNYRLKDESGRLYLKDNLTAAKPGGDTSYEWRGVKPYKGRYWAYSKAKMEQFEAEGRLVYTANGMPQYKRYLDEMPGVPIQDVWLNIHPVRGSESEDYDGQKPVALLDRILQASSNKGDLVLDPFLGSGTTAVVAQRLERLWIGIELSEKASFVARRRLDKEFGDGCYMQANDWPADVEAAKALAKSDPYVFQCWVVKQLKGFPTPRGADRGIDGNLPIFGFSDGRSKNAIIQVKGGGANVGQVREFATTLNMSGAALGLFVAWKDNVTPGMKEVAAYAGTFQSGREGDFENHPKIQILYVEDIFNRGLRYAGARFPGYLKEPDYTQTKSAEIQKERGNANFWLEMGEQE